MSVMQYCISTAASLEKSLNLCIFSSYCLFSTFFHLKNQQYVSVSQTKNNIVTKFKHILSPLAQYLVFHEHYVHNAIKKKHANSSQQQQHSALYLWKSQVQRTSTLFHYVCKCTVALASYNISLCNKVNFIHWLYKTCLHLIKVLL